MSFCNEGKVVGTKDLEIPRFTEKRFTETIFFGKRQRSGLTGTTPLICTSPVYRILCFFPEFPQGLLVHPWETPLTDYPDNFCFVQLTIAQELWNTYPKRKEVNINIQVRCMQPCIYFKNFAAGLMKVTASHKEHVTMKGFRVFLDMRRYKKWDHKIS